MSSLMILRGLIIYVCYCHANISDAFTPSNGVWPGALKKDANVNVRSIAPLYLGGGDGDLTSALARLNDDFERTNLPTFRPTGIQQGWTRLMLENGDDASDPETTSEQASDYVYLLEPPSATPSLLILFVGGAGLGQFPHIAYSECLTRISTKLNAAVIAAPYPVGLDHFELATRSYSLLTRAVSQCEEGGYSETMPKFLLGHSLGCKLLTLSLAASGLPSDANGVGMISYNNFGFRDTIGMMKSFADQMDIGAMGGGIGGPNPQVLDAILGFAEQAVDMTGFEFNPSPTDTERIIRMRYNQNIQAKTRMFVMDNDNLDCSQGFIDACREGASDNNLGQEALSVSNLPGEHLAPAFVKLSLDDLTATIPDEARQVVGEIADGFQSASLGDEESLDLLVNEIYDWIMGKPPSKSTSESSDSKRITGAVPPE